MAELELMCSICRVLVTNHAYGKPVPRDLVLNKAAIPSHKGRNAKSAFETLRQRAFIVDHGKRGIQLDSSAFGALIRFLHDTCGWDRFELELRIKHFEGWDEILWKNGR